MKKIYILLFILLFLPFDIFALEEVTLQREQVPDVWFTRTGGENLMSHIILKITALMDKLFIVYSRVLL